MAFYVPADWIDGDEPDAAAFNLQFRDNLKYLNGTQAGQQDITLDAACLAPGFELQDAGPELRQALGSGTAKVRFAALSTTNFTGKLARLAFAVGERDGGTREALGEMAAERTGSGSGKLSISAYTDGAAPSTPALAILASGLLGLSKLSPTYDLDVGGTCKPDSLRIGGAVVGKWTASPVSLPTFSGSGLDDLETGTEYTAEGAKSFVVEIDSTGTPDTFRWSQTGGVSWAASGVAITGSPQTLASGVTVTFGATTGHTRRDRWSFDASLARIMRYVGKARVTGTLSGGASARITGSGPSLRVASRTKVTNLNAAALRGFDWPSAALQAARTTSLTGDWTSAQTVTSVTTTRAGWHIVFAFVRVLVGSGEDTNYGSDFTVQVPGSREIIGGAPRSGDIVPVKVLSRYLARSGELLAVTIQNPSSIGTSSAKGFIVAAWYAGPGFVGESSVEVEPSFGAGSLA